MWKTVRYSWVVFLIALLCSCGQPLQMQATPQKPLTPQPTAQAIIRSPQPGLVPTRAGGSDSSATVIVLTATVAQASEPSPSAAPPVVIVPLTPKPQTNEQRWRTQQHERQVFEPRRIYVARGPVPLMWYDPRTGQSLEVGTLVGEFPAQAQFVFRPRAVSALEILYRIDQDFGLTAISPAVKQRMKDAGYEESVEAYVIQNDYIQLKQ